MEKLDFLTTLFLGLNFIWSIRNIDKKRSYADPFRRVFASGVCQTDRGTGCVIPVSVASKLGGVGLVVGLANTVGIVGIVSLIY